MKKYKYSNKITSKKWNNKKSSLWQQKKSTSYKRQTPMVGQRPSTWRFPGMLIIVSLMMIILVVPTLIVLPFVSDSKQESLTVEKEASKEAVETDDTAISVAVMRTQSEEIENVPLETYVTRVVASEMPAEFETEALKSQALAARTYIVNHMLHESTDESAVTDTVQHQVYNNEDDLRKLWGKEYNSKMKKITEAVEATKGEVLTYNDAPITPAFFSTSNGYTENSEDYWDNELPYLRSVKSPWDEESPKFLDQQTFTINEVENALNIDLPNGTAIPIEATRTAGHRVDQLKLGDHAIKGREIREKLKLQSSDFTIKQKNDHLIFTTKGFGHGIGMSQYGANGMAQEGKKYEEIVKYYYKDVEISKVGDIASKLVAKE